MYHILYAVLALVSCALAALVWLKRRDLGLHMLVAGCAGGGLEVLSEYWYLQDYWHPGTLLGFPAPEDFAYGFGTTAFTIGVVPLLFRAKYTFPVLMLSWQMRASYGVASLVGFAIAMQVGQRYTSLPSIWLATIAFAALGCANFMWVPEAFEPAAVAAAVMAVIALVGYGIGLNWVVDGDNYLHQVYLLWHTNWDNRLWGVPIDEIAWNAARAWAVTSLYMVVNDRMLPPRL